MEGFFTIILITLVSIVIVLLLLLLNKMGRDIKDSRMETIQYINNSFKTYGDMVFASQKDAIDMQEKRLEQIRETMEKQIDNIRMTVDEKLQKTLEDKISQSFRLVSERLEQVYKGLGEMQTLAAGVGDLKKVLTNVKTRGILGEIQLGAILEQILTRDQYEENVKTKPTGSERVEYAVKLPGNDDGYVYLPIDAKFPGDAYSRLMDAYEKGIPSEIEEAAKILEKTIKSEAKDIHNKYVEPPYTTDFAIMFLPFEGLYAEVVRRGLLETLQKEYKVNIAGPTTMAALLNSLQMGFKTLAIQKHSSEVWEVLGAVKTEFEKFDDVLAATQQRINQANAELDKLIGTRTRSIQRKLRGISSLPEGDAKNILEIEE
ncbi:MAG: DNA recombination protein RmuC [Eubacteriales bacterium]|nr:DNA recombination protein RmuC [Eubacteriales bacterium]